MLLIALVGAIRDQSDRLEGIHLPAESDEIDDSMPARLIVHQPNNRLVALEVRPVGGLGGFEVGQVELLDFGDHVLLDVLPLHLVHEQVCIAEEELGIRPILGLHEFAVEAVGRHGTHDLVPMQKDV